MSKVSLTMRTIDRKSKVGVGYFRDTIDNLKRAGVFDSRYYGGLSIVDSTNDDGRYFNEEVAPTTRGLPNVKLYHSPGLTPNGAATRCHELHSDYDTALKMFLEDDIDVCDRFLESVMLWMKGHINRQYLLYSFGANYAQIVNARQAGNTYWKYPVDAYYGTQCYVVASGVNVKLVEYLRANPKYERGNASVDRCHDLRLGKWAQSLGCRYFLASVPSFIQHIGLESGMGCPKFQFRSWPGRDWSYEGVVGVRGTVDGLEKSGRLYRESAGVSR